MLIVLRIGRRPGLVIHPLPTAKIKEIVDHTSTTAISMAESTIRLHIEPLDEGGYVATSPDVPGLVAQGRTLAEVAEIAQDVARKIAESCVEHGDPLPPALAGRGEVDVDVFLNA